MRRPEQFQLFSEQPVPVDPREIGPKRLQIMHRMYGIEEGRHCRECAHFRRFERGAKWFKCGKTRYTGGAATDWRARWTACGLFEEA